MTQKDILEARELIKPYVHQTPLLRLHSLDKICGCKVFVKAECMQLTGSFKLRGALNKMLRLTKEELEKGVVTASSGNHGRAVSYAAKLLGTTALVVVPNTATLYKIEEMKKLGAEVVICEESERFNLAETIRAESERVMIPPFNDELVMAGQGTVALEVLDQEPQVDAVVLPIAGGGLTSGVAYAIKNASSLCKVIAAEPSKRARYKASLKAGKPVEVKEERSIADALAALRPGELCFPYIQKHVDQVVAVEDDFILKAMKVLLLEGKILAEPSSCIGIGAVIQGLVQLKSEEKVCFILSGGNVSLEQLQALNGMA